MFPISHVHALHFEKYLWVFLTLCTIIARLLDFEKCHTFLASMTICTHNKVAAFLSV